jgi:broad specificity phosphatase PhoE
VSLVIKLVRHGESLANVGDLNPAEVGDHTIGLTQLGQEQARRAGQHLGAACLVGALAYCSPFRRARETMAGLLEGAGVPPGGVRVYEDPRLREVEHGYTDVTPQEALKWTPNPGPLDRGVFVNALPHFNRGYGKDSRPNRTST